MSREKNALSVREKKLICEHKAQNPGEKYAELLAFSEKNFNKTPSSSQISRVLKEKEKWLATNENARPVKRIKLAKWPDLERALDLWLVQVSS